MTTLDLCPLCSAGIGGCEHEIVRWSYVAGELEPCVLKHDVETFADALYKSLRQQWVRGEVPKSHELRRLCEACASSFADEPNEAEGRSQSDIVDYVFAIVAKVPGVAYVDEGPTGRPETRVLWARDPDAIRENLRALVRKLEVEFSRQEDDS